MKKLPACRAVWFLPLAISQLPHSHRAPIVRGAIALDRTALKELLARIDGPVMQKMAVEEKVRQVLEFVVAKKPTKKVRRASDE